MQAHERLEIEWAEFNGLDPAGMVACSSGTSALHLSLESLRLPAHSEVVTGDFNMVAVPRATVLAGLTPVFVDCDELLLIDSNLVAEAIANSASEWEKDITNPRFGLPYKMTVSALVLVHIYGRHFRWDRLTSDLPFHGPCIIEDLAEAHGVRPHPQTDAACWSFYRNKIVAGEEGGSVWFRNHDHAALARQLRCLGFTPKHNFMHIPRGHNYRMSNVHAELILDSLHRYPENLARRREIEAWYEEECPEELRMPNRDAPWVYDMRVPDGRQDELIERLHAAGIQARYWFRPMSEQPEFVNCKLVGSGNALRLSRLGIYLPLTPGITREQVRKSFEVIRACLGV